MEKIVKVYSNNSKKARLKRNKNKFQRIWDAEKQTYVKVRKAKYPVRTQVKRELTKELIKLQMNAVKRHQEAIKKPKTKKSVPVSAKKQEPEKVIAHKVHAKSAPTPIKKPVSIVMYGNRRAVWDDKAKKYLEAA